MEERINKIENRLDNIESKLKITLKPGKDVKCKHCGWVMRVRSKMKLISCSSCGGKTENTSLESEEKPEKFDAFEGKRYEDYDDKFGKDYCFKNKKTCKCDQCGKKVTYENSFYGYNQLRCKKCYASISLSDHEAVSEMTKRI